MIPYEVDPSLHPAAPAPERLDDGFSPPAEEQAPAVPPAEPRDAVLGPKSEF